MEPYKSFTGIVGLLNRNNVDTDQIIPKQFLKRVERTGFGKYLFQDWRFNKDGSENTSFELNQPEAQGCSILLSGDNFGCGSSREHAPWSLADYGLKCIIATSFADIFFNNCFKNAILPIKVTAAQQKQLANECDGKTEFSIDLEGQKITTQKGTEIAFEVDPFRKESLLSGLDDIGHSLSKMDQILAFEEKQKQELPWLWK